MGRVCKTCGEDKALEEFPSNGQGQRRRVCRPCHLAKRRAESTTDEYRARRRAAYHANPEPIRELNKRFYWKDPEAARIKQRAASRRFRQNNPDKVRAKSLRDALRRRHAYDRESEAYAYEVLLADPCSYCGAPSDTLDHIVPLKARGDRDWTNLTGACRSCNCGKRDRSLLAFLLLRSPDK